MWARGRRGAPGTVHPLTGPLFPAALCSPPWVRGAQATGTFSKDRSGRGHIGPWAPDDRAWSLSPLSQAGRAPRVSVLAWAWGTAGERMTAKRGALQSMRAWGTTAEGPRRPVRH